MHSARLVAAVAELGSLGVMSAPQPRFPRWTVATLVVALLGNLLAASFPVYSLLHLPAGSSVRLMADAFHAGIVSLVTLLVVSVLAIVSFRREHYRVLAVVALCLALTPLYYSGWALNRVAEMRGIVLEP